MLRIGEKLIREDEEYSRTLDICLADDYLPRSVQLFKDIISDRMVAVPAKECTFENYNPKEWKTLACKKYDGKWYWLVMKYD